MKGPKPFSFEDQGAGRFKLSGHMGFENAARALAESHKLFADHKKLQLDLSGVDSADSAGLALLVEWTGWAKREKRKLSFINTPKQVIALAKISEVDKILPLD
jgi:phospholipid transport system transporter-binding protein